MKNSPACGRSPLLAIFLPKVFRGTARGLFVLFAVYLLGAGGAAAQAQQPPPEKPRDVVLQDEAPPKPAPTPREAEEQRGDLMMARRHFSEAIEIYQKLLAREPKNAALLNKVGIAYHQMHDLRSAKKYYERSAKADKTFAPAFNNLGTVHYNEKRYRNAINAYKKSIAANPNLAAVHTNMGYAYFARKQFENALLSFHRALELDPEILERRSATGTLLQDRTVADRAFFYFFLAKSFALVGNAERCAHYLRLARDEGYKEIASALKDPAFAEVLKDPQVLEVLQPQTPIARLP